MRNFVTSLALVLSGCSTLAPPAPKDPVAPKPVKTYNDGCNDCTLDSNGVATCTMKFCPAKGG